MERETEDEYTRKLRERNRAFLKALEEDNKQFKKKGDSALAYLENEARVAREKVAAMTAGGYALLRGDQPAIENSDTDIDLEQGEDGTYR